MNHYPHELRADFQEYYRLNLDGMGWQYSTVHAANLAAMLPRDSRVFVAFEPANAWGQVEWLLASIQYYVHVLVWARSEDAKHKKHPPFDMPQPPKKKKKTPREEIDVEAIKERLARPRR